MSVLFFLVGEVRLFFFFSVRVLGRFIGLALIIIAFFFLKYRFRGGGFVVFV